MINSVDFDGKISIIY